MSKETLQKKDGIKNSLGESYNKYMKAVKKYEKIDKYLKSLFVLLLMMNIVGRFLNTTTYGVYSGSTIVGVSMSLLKIVLLCRIIFLFSYDNECKRAIVICGMLFLINCFMPSGFYKEFGIILLGCLGIDYRKVLKAYVITIGIGITFTIFVSLVGATNHLVWLMDGSKIRDSFGVCYPTDFASYLFFLLLFFWVAWNHIPSWVTAVLCVCTLLIVYVFAQSDTCTICCIVFLAVIGLYNVAKLGKEKMKGQMIQKIVDILLMLAFPLCSLLMFVLIFCYSKGIPFFIKLNGILTGRLGLTLNAIKKYGLSLGGVAIKQAGNGFTTFPVPMYEFVDSSYPLILLTRGIIFFILLNVIIVFVSWRAIRNKDYRLAFCLALIALHALSEHHLMELNYNPLIYLPCALYPNIRIEESGAVKNCVNKNFLDKNRPYFIALIISFVVLLFAPVWLSLVRTICGWRRFLEDEFELAWAVAGYCFIVLPVVCMIIAILAKKKKRIIFSSLTAALIVILVIFSAVALNNAKKDVANIYQNDINILKELDKASTGSLYSTELPWLLKKDLRHLRFVTMTGDDLGRKKKATIIVPRRTEYYILLRLNFQYAAISDNIAVYSNDPAVLQYLKNHGFVAHDYFDELMSVELPLTKMEELYLRKGNYQIEITMHVRKRALETESIANIMIVGNSGYEILYKEPVSGKEVNEGDILKLMIPVGLKDDTPGIHIYALNEGDNVVDVNEVTYQMVGKYREN